MTEHDIIIFILIFLTDIMFPLAFISVLFVIGKLLKPDND